MAFPFLPGNQAATEERLRYLYQLRNEIQQRNVYDTNIQSQACADIAQADNGVTADIGGEDEEQRSEQTRRKLKHAAFSLLKPLRLLSLESLSAASSLHQTQSLPKGSEGSGYVVASQHPGATNENTPAKTQHQIETLSVESYGKLFKENMLDDDCNPTQRCLGSDFSTLSYRESQCLDIRRSPPHNRVGISSNSPSSQSQCQLHCPSLHQPMETSLETKQYQWPSNYPATEMFRRCSQALTNPFSLGFVIDPTKLNSASLLLSGLDVERQRYRTGQEQIKIVDVGGRVSDEYVSRIGALPRVSVCKAVQKLGCNATRPQTPTHSSESSQGRQIKQRMCYDKNITTLTLDNLAELPFATATVDVIIARCLYKNRLHATSYLTSTTASLSAPDPSRNETKLCLQEFFRVLSPGGCFEYVYFDRRLYNPQLLTAAMEPFFYEDANQHCHCVNTLSRKAQNANEVPPRNFSYPHSQFEKSPSSLVGDHQSIGLSAAEFLALVEIVGFTPVRNTVLWFPVTTLSTLFTPEGLRRQTASIYLGSVDDAESVSKLNSATTELLERIHRECMTSDTSWKCIVGWAKKP